MIQGTGCPCYVLGALHHLLILASRMSLDTLSCQQVTLNRAQKGSNSLHSKVLELEAPVYQGSSANALSHIWSTHAHPSIFQHFYTNSTQSPQYPRPNIFHGSIDTYHVAYIYI